MNEVLGLIDSIEATILESSKVPMTGKIILEEKKILRLIDKLRLVINGSDDVIRKAVDVTFNVENKAEASRVQTHQVNSGSIPSSDPVTIVEEARKEAEIIKRDAADYADYILANLQLMITKVQKNVINVEKNIDTSRDMLERHKDYEKTEGEYKYETK
ncbi:hypothetical protein DID80_03935 [Candidatus Marinamargulisbacteria bacterium SCGC AAA071-K20]|nr:hypothetical protein DID80_03935 [Candidatus Marinamargulisbacteria bacterium SCGC AAA071-K20]